MQTFAYPDQQPRRYHHDSVFVAPDPVPLDPDTESLITNRARAWRKPHFLSALARAVLDALIAFARKGNVTPSYQHLAEAAGTCVPNVYRCLKKLRAMGFVRWVRRIARRVVIDGYTNEIGWQVEQTSNSYQVLLPSPELQKAAELHLSLRKKERKEKLAQEKRDGTASLPPDQGGGGNDADHSAECGGNPGTSKGRPEADGLGGGVSGLDGAPAQGGQRALVCDGKAGARVASALRQNAWRPGLPWLPGRRPGPRDNHGIMKPPEPLTDAEKAARRLLYAKKPPP